MTPGWIMIRQEMPDKREVGQLAAALGIDFDSVIGKLVRLWLWAERQRIDCNELNVTPALLDRLTNCPGFTAALIDVGWLTDRNGRLYAPDFAQYNGQTAKNRALTKDRVQRWRAEQGHKNRNTSSVTSKNGGSLFDPPYKGSSTKKKVPREYPKPFEEFWLVYPLKTGKEAALRAWTRAVERIRKRKGVSREDAIACLRAAAEAFAASDKAQGEFCPHASTWLNQGRYDDDPAAWMDRKSVDADPRGNLAAAQAYLAKGRT